MWKDYKVDWFKILWKINFYFRCCYTGSLQFFITIQDSVNFRTPMAAVLAVEKVFTERSTYICKLTSMNQFVWTESCFAKFIWIKIILINNLLRNKKKLQFHYVVLKENVSAYTLNLRSTLSKIVSTEVCKVYLNNKMFYLNLWHYKQFIW